MKTIPKEMCRILLNECGGSLWDNEASLFRSTRNLSRFEQGKDDFIENIDDVCIHYDGGRTAANESLVAEIRARGLRKATKETGLDRKTIRAILNGKKVKIPTLAKVVMGLRQE